MTEAPALHLAEIAAAPGPLPERAQALLVELRRHVPFDASWISLAEPRGTGYTFLASTSLNEKVVQHLTGSDRAHGIEVLATWAPCLVPAGYHDGIAVGLFAPESRPVGVLALLSTRAQLPTPAIRRRLTRLTPILARGLDPMRCLLTAARLVQGAVAGVVVWRDGRTAPLPGLVDDSLLAGDSAVLGAARTAIRNGHLYTSFLWPRGGRHAPQGHVRVTVLMGPDDVGAC